MLHCSGLRNGTAQCFGTAAKEGAASAFADAAPSCFFAHSLFSFCVTSSTMRWRSSSLCALPYSFSASSRSVSIFRDHTSNTPLLIVPFRVRAKYFCRPADVLSKHRCSAPYCGSCWWLRSPGRSCRPAPAPVRRNRRRSYPASARTSGRGT